MNNKERKKQWKASQSPYCRCAAHTFDPAEMIETTVAYSMYDYYKERPIPLRVYRCPICDKTYSDAPAEA